MTKLHINQGQLPNIVFSVKFTCAEPFLILDNVFCIQVMASGNLPPHRREVVVRGDRNCFYGAIALWNDEVGDEKHEEIRRLSSSLIERNPKVFEPLLFSSNSVENHVKNSKITGTWAETVDIFTCASLLERLICTFSSSQKINGTTLNRLRKLIRFHRSQRRRVSVQSLCCIMMSMLRQIILISFCLEVAVVVLLCLRIQHPLF